MQINMDFEGVEAYILFGLSDLKHRHNFRFFELHFLMLTYVY